MPQRAAAKPANRGSRSVAALFAMWASSRGSAAAAAAKALELDLGEGRIHVGGREMAHQPDGVGGGSEQLPGAEAPHARVELQVEGNALRKRRLGDGELESCVTRDPNVSVARRAHDENARVGNAERSATPSPTVATQSARAPSASATRATSTAPWP